MAWILFLIFLGLVLIRVPIVMAIGAAVLMSLVYAGFANNLYIVPQQILEGVEAPSLLAVPFFVLAGNLMNAVGITDKIFNFALAMVGHFRAGLAQVNVIGSAIFGGVQGSTVADIAGLGNIEIKAMRERGYPVDFAAALTVVTAMLGTIIPPSISMVIYAFLSNVSVARMFLGGVVPGLLTTLALMLYVRIVADRRGFPREPRASLRTIAVTARHGIAAIIAPGIIFASITTGFTTSTEAGVIACAYSLLLGAAYRSLDARKLWKAITDTMLVTALIMMILGFSTVMSWLIAIEQVPQAIAAQILTTTDNLYVFLAILLVFFLIVGCFVEGVPAKIILVPMLLPLIDRFGIDRVHFGLIIVFAFVIGVATPPMGIGLYIAVGVSGETFEKITMAALPMLIPPIIVLVLITYIPGLVLWLPNLVMGPP